jgi:carboxypeptidase Taq
MSQTYEKLKQHIDKTMAYRTALTLLHWDLETSAPEESMNNTAKVIGLLSVEELKSFINEEVRQLLEELSQPKEQELLDFNQKAIVKALKKSYEQMEHIPPEEYQAYEELTAKSSAIWAKAKETNSFEDFKPALTDILGYQKKFAGYRSKEGDKLYDILLNDYEEDFSTEKLDTFFNKIKAAIIPLLKDIAAKQDFIDKSYNSLHYDKETQLNFAKYVSEYVGYDFKKGVLAESAHPFTTHLHNHDVRITTHIYENNLESSIFSVIHESGHGIYEMYVDDAITLSPVGQGSSMGIHESQSRFYENIIGRSQAFWTPLYPKLQESFPEQLKNVTLEQFVNGINKSVPSLIRTEADELSYSLHIIIRYEVEKMLFEDKIKVEDLPTVWKQKYKEYLGIEPETDSNGVLQDIHWSCGMFGYFPSYALGSAIAAQLYYYMSSVMPIETYLKEGNLVPIREFLNNAIHKYGATKNTNELLMELMNEELNADYYIKYLTEKYTKLYNL